MNISRIAFACIALALAAARPAQAQAEIKVNDTGSFRLGIVGRFQFDTIDHGLRKEKKPVVPA